MDDESEKLTGELRSFRPSAPSPTLQERIGESLAGEAAGPQSKSPIERLVRNRSLVAAVCLIVAAVVFVVAAALLPNALLPDALLPDALPPDGDPAPEVPRVAQSDSVDNETVDSAAGLPTLASFYIAMADSPAAFESLLDQHRGGFALPAGRELRAGSFAEPDILRLIESGEDF